MYEAGKHAAELHHRRPVVHVAGLQSAKRHTVGPCVGRVLHDGKTAALLHGGQPCRAVIQQSRQHHADDAWSVADCSRAKERIDGRSSHILARSASKAARAVEEEKVVIGGCDINLAELDRRTILRGDHWKRATALQRAGEVGEVLTDMHDD
ncbi:MAG TPA: hypothetical protein VGM07_17610 [Stellaceae bacterium]